MNLENLLTAVAHHLAAAGHAAVVDYVPEQRLDELTAPVVVVSPAYTEGDGPLSEEPSARRVTQQTGRVSVALIAPLAPPATVAGHNATLESLRATLRHAGLTAYPAARWRRQELIAAPSPEHLRQHGAYLGVFHAEYTLHQPAA